MSAHNLAMVVSTISIFNAEPNLEGCSSANLNAPCQHNFAVDQSNCLSERINKFYECNAKVDWYEEQIQKTLEKRAEEKGLVVVDSLKAEVARHLQKMRELENTLEWHDRNLQRLSIHFALWAKEFEISYKASESATKDKIKELWKATVEVQDYLDLINLSFDVRSVLSEEQSLGDQHMNRSIRFLREFDDVSTFVNNELLLQKSYVEKYSLESLLPNFGTELEFTRSVGIYAQSRKERVEKECKRLLRHIDARMRELREEKIRRDTDRDFSDAYFIDREITFHKQIANLAQIALKESDHSQFSQYELMGARYAALQELLSLESLCREEALKRAENSWTDWGCRKLTKVLESLNAQKVLQIPARIRGALLDLESEKVTVDLGQKSEILESLELGHVDRAVKLYDELLNQLKKAGNV